MVAATALLVACGGDQAQTSTGVPGAQASSAVRQVMATVVRGDVVETAFGQLELTGDAAKPEATVQLSGDGADQVAAGQSVTVMIGGPGRGAGQPSGQPIAPPSSGAGDQGQASPPPQGGQGYLPDAAQGGAQGMPPSGMIPGEGGTDGTVLSVESADDGTVTAVVRLDELPDGVSVGDQGMAVVQIGVLAEDVLLVPTQAIAEADDATTVTVIVDGNSEQREVEVGAQGTTMSEIVSGLSEGDDVVYEVQFGAGAPGGVQPSGMPGAATNPPTGAQTQE